MAGPYNEVMILGVVLIGVVVGVEGVTDQQFQELSDVVERLQDENIRQFSLISQLKTENNHQTAVINQLQTVLKMNNLLFEPEVEIPAGERTQNTTIEERVALLEIQVTDLEENVSDLDQDVNFLFDEQVIQDERLLNLEETSDTVTVELVQINEDTEGLEDTTLALDFRVTVLEENGGGGGNSSISELEDRVETLEGTTADHETKITASESSIEDLQGTSADQETRLTAAEENIQGLQVTDINLDARITALEENGGGGSSQNETIAFFAILTAYDTIAVDDTLVFNQIASNEGNGYDSTTGVFTVPSGGEGLYYFSTYLLVPHGEFSEFDMMLNDESICFAVGDHITSGSGDSVQATCSGVVNIVEGDEVKVVLGYGDDTPLYETTIVYVNGFSGFRI